MLYSSYRSTQSGVGLAIKSEYRFLGMKTTPEYSETSLIAAGVYLVFAVVSLIVTFYKKSVATPIGALPLASGPTRGIEMSDRKDQTEYRTPNPSFTQADASSSLLVNK